MRKRSGYTLIEIIIVMVVLAVLLGSATVIGGKSIENARIRSTTNDMQIFAADMTEIYDDMGVLSFDNGLDDEQKITAIKEFLDGMSKGYLSFDFDLETLEITEEYFVVKTGNTMLDAWRKPYTMYYSISNENAGKIIFLSSGSNLKSYESGYQSGDFSDDIVMLLKPRG